MQERIENDRDTIKRAYAEIPEYGSQGGILRWWVRRVRSRALTLAMRGTQERIPVILKVD